MSIGACIYCGSKGNNFGFGCPFSDKKVHFKPNNEGRCCWCGSKATGAGCAFNPHSKNHLHGIDFNQMMGDSVENGIVLGYLMKNLSDPYTESRAYALKLIDENGTILRKPETDEEKAAFTILDEYTLTIKKLLGNKIDLVNSMASMKIQESMTMDNYKIIVESKLNYAEEFKKLGEAFNQLAQNAVLQGLSVPAVEKLIVDSIFKKK